MVLNCHRMFVCSASAMLQCRNNKSGLGGGGEGGRLWNTSEADFSSFQQQPLDSPVQCVPRLRLRPLQRLLSVVKCHRTPWELVHQRRYRIPSPAISRRSDNNVKEEMKEKSAGLNFLAIGTKQFLLSRDVDGCSGREQQSVRCDARDGRNSLLVWRIRLRAFSFYLLDLF